MATITEHLGLKKHSYIPSNKRRIYKFVDKDVAIADINEMIKLKPGKAVKYSDLAIIAGYRSTSGFRSFMKTAQFKSEFTLMPINNRNTFIVRNSSPYISNASTIPAPVTIEERLSDIAEQSQAKRTGENAVFHATLDHYMWEFIKSQDADADLVAYIKTFKSFATYLKEHYTPESNR